MRARKLATAPVATAPTPEQLAERRLDRLRYDCGALGSLGRSSLVSWRDSIAKALSSGNAQYEMEWSQSWFVNSAEATVWLRAEAIGVAVFTEALTKGQPEAEARRTALEAVLAEARRETVRGARYGANNSTSAASNLAEACKTAAWAELLIRYTPKLTTES